MFELVIPAMGEDWGSFIDMDLPLCKAVGAQCTSDGTVTPNSYRRGGPDWVADMFWHMLVAKMPGPSALNKLSHEVSQKHSAVSCPLFKAQRGMS